MSNGHAQVGAATASTPTVRSMANEIAENLVRLQNDITRLRKVMEQAGICEPEVESINKATDLDAPRESSLTSTVRYANNDLRINCNDLESLINTLETEIA